MHKVAKMVTYKIMACGAILAEPMFFNFDVRAILRSGLSARPKPMQDMGQ